VGAVTALAALVVLMLSACAHPGVADAVATTPAPLLSAPAPGNAQAGQDSELQLPWDGVDRNVLLHTPASWSAGQQLPLVVALHGFGGDGRSMLHQTRLDELADQYGFLVAYPDGIDGNWTALYCCQNNDDVGFIHAMVDQLTHTWGADASRVYATGFSQGAELTYRLAVELPGMFAAIAPVAAGFDISGVAAAPPIGQAVPYQ
jgi:polyhydroxybutyrate depolymerase